MVIVVLFLLAVAGMLPSSSRQPTAAAPPPPSRDTYNGIFLQYTYNGVFQSTIRLPLRRQYFDQGYAFQATLTLLNTGVHTLKSWQTFVGFWHREVLISTSDVPCSPTGPTSPVPNQWQIAMRFS